MILQDEAHDFDDFIKRFQADWCICLMSPWQPCCFIRSDRLVAKQLPNDVIIYYCTRKSIARWTENTAMSVKNYADISYEQILTN